MMALAVILVAAGCLCIASAWGAHLKYEDEVQRWGRLWNVQRMPDEPTRVYRKRIIERAGASWDADSQQITQRWR